MIVSSKPLASPFSIGPATLRNRILMAPITTNYADEAGNVTDKTLGFYGERARGGAGALIFEALSVSEQAKLTIRGYDLHNDNFIEGLAQVTDLVHQSGARVFAQLCHAGPKARSALNGLQSVSASEVAVKVGDPPRAVTRSEISQIVDQFAAAAVRARRAGFDGIELHAAHFYLLSAFLSGHLNRRSDEYGGSVENRSRLVCDIVRAVKAHAGGDFPVLCRIHAKETLPDGIDEAQAQQIARLLEAAGVDAIHVSAGTVEVDPRIARFYSIRVGGPTTKECSPGCFVPYAAVVKQAVSVPVIAVGKLNDPIVAEEVIRTGAADLVAIGRGMIADPYLPQKMLTGRWDDIVKCTDCLSCHTTMVRQRDMECSVNVRPWRPKGYVAGQYKRAHR